jgi:hypothetical protein
MYSKNVLERAVLKLKELKLIELDSLNESLWNCDIVCTSEERQEKLPYFLQQILKSLSSSCHSIPQFILIV